jgi:hypothetical protein
MLMFLRPVPNAFVSVAGPDDFGPDTNPNPTGTVLYINFGLTYYIKNFSKNGQRPIYELFQFSKIRDPTKEARIRPDPDPQQCYVYFRDLTVMKCEYPESGGRYNGDHRDKIFFGVPPLQVRLIVFIGIRLLTKFRYSIR